MYVAWKWKNQQYPSFLRSILFWVAVCQDKFVHVCMLSCSVVWLFVIPQTVAHQPPLSIGFSRQEYWTGLPFPSPGDLPDPGIERRSALQADSLPTELQGKPLSLFYFIFWNLYLSHIYKLLCSFSLKKQNYMHFNSSSFFFFFFLQTWNFIFPRLPTTCSTSGGSWGTKKKKNSFQVQS